MRKQFEPGALKITSGSHPAGVGEDNMVKTLRTLGYTIENPSD